MEKSDVLIVAVKPSVVPIALGDIKRSSGIDTDKLFLSIAMGITIKQLEQVRLNLLHPMSHYQLNLKTKSYSIFHQIQEWSE